MLYARNLTCELQSVFPHRYVMDRRLASDIFRQDVGLAELRSPAYANERLQGSGFES